MIDLDEIHSNAFGETEKRHIMNEIAGFILVQHQDTENGTYNLSYEI